MTLPSSYPISTGHILAELKITNPSRTYPLNLFDADVRALAGVPSGPISMANLLGKSSYVPMTVTGVNASASFNSAVGAGTAVCNPSVTVSGGSGGRTYAWSFTSNPNTCTLGSATSQTCSVSKAYGLNATGSASAVLQCSVTDSTSTTVTATGVTANLDWSNGA